MKIKYLVATFLLAFALGGCQYTEIEPGEVGVTTDWGELTGWVYDSGFHWHAPGIDVHVLSTQVRIIDMSGENRITALSQDRLPMGLDITVQYQMNRAQAPQVYQNFRDDLDDRIVVPSAREAVRDVMAHFNAEQAIQQRDQLGPQMSATLTTSIGHVLQNAGVGANAVHIIGVQVRNVTLPEEIQASIQRIQHARNGAQERAQQVRVAEQEAARAAAEARGAAAVAQIQANQAAAVRETASTAAAAAIRITAEANADANRSLSSSLTPLLLRQRSIEAQMELARHVQNLTVVSGGGGSSTVIPIPMPGSR